MAYARSNKAFIAWSGLIGLQVFALILAVAVDCPAGDLSSEYEVKAAFIYNFIKFIDWPDERGAGITVCFAGENPFGEALGKINGKTVRGGRISVRETGNTKGCRVLFISSSEAWHVSQIVHGLSGLNILTIGDTEGYAQKGVIINFYMEGDRVRFEINPGAAEKAGIKISSKLLNLAAIVHTVQ